MSHLLISLPFYEASESSLGTYERCKDGRVTACQVVRSYSWTRLQGLRRVLSTFAGSFALYKKNPIKMKSLKPLFIWLKVLYGCSLVPRDGIGSACSLVFIKVHFVLKERLCCPLLFVANCCQSSALLSLLLSSLKTSMHMSSPEVNEK